MLAAYGVPALLLVFGTWALWSDWKSRKIPNSLCLSFWIVGTFLHLSTDLSWDVLGAIALSLGTAFICYFPLYLLRVLGAGDVKLLLALSSLGTFRWTADVGLLAIVLGGFLALLWIGVQGRLKRFGTDLLWALVRLKEAGVSQAHQEIQKGKPMPFALPMVLAAWLCLWFSPIQILFGR